MNLDNLIENSRPYLAHLLEWEANLQAISVNQLVQEPEKVAIVSIDVINGFCTEGPLASPRINDIADPIAELFELAWDLAVRKIVLIQEAHEPDAVEFGQYPPHCIRGSSEAESVPEFKALPFYDRLTIIPKNSISPAAATGFDKWIEQHPEVETYVVVGDCTDLCTYQLAMHLRLEANARQLQRRVVAPADCIDTYDLPVETARKIGATPHDGDLLHLIFLHHMHQNGIEVVRSIV